MAIIPLVLQPNARLQRSLRRVFGDHADRPYIPDRRHVEENGSVLLPSEERIMSRTGKLAGCVVALGAVVALSSPAAAIKCVKGFQRVQGNLIATPYCQDQYLAEVARQRGFKASAAKIRNNPNYKKELCRFVASDIRVQTTCLDAGVPEFFGGGAP
jgi:hypothetical protein